MCLSLGTKTANSIVRSEAFSLKRKELYMQEVEGNIKDGKEKKKEVNIVFLMFLLLTISFLALEILPLNPILKRINSECYNSVYD